MVEPIRYSAEGSAIGVPVSADNPLPAASRGVKSTGNSSNTALAEDAVFSGAWVVNYYPHFAVNVKADQAGTLTIKLGILKDGISPSGTITDSDVVETFSGATAISANQGYFRTLVNVPGRAVKISYTNGPVAQTSFALLTGFGDNLFPSSGSEDNELLTVQTEALRNVFAAYSTGAITVNSTTWACLIDLSDTTNWKHDRTGRVDISVLDIEVDKSSNCTGDVALGVITRVDATNGDVTFFADLIFDNADGTRLTIDRNYSPSAIRCGVTAGVATKIATNDVALNETAIQTDVPLASFRGAGTVTPAVGDIVAKFVKNAGTTMTVYIELLYHGERSA